VADHQRVKTKPKIPLAVVLTAVFIGGLSFAGLSLRSENPQAAAVKAPASPWFVVLLALITAPPAFFFVLKLLPQPRRSRPELHRPVVTALKPPANASLD
jgi:hypothetical protein